MGNIVIIAAYAENRVIGRAGKIPWEIKEDLSRFMQLTMRRPVIMGRKTYESILSRNGKPLPNRTNIVLTADPNYLIKKLSSDDVRVARNLDAALERAFTINEEVCIIGGERVYREAIPQANKMCLTEVHFNFEGDAFFPDFSLDEWEVAKREDFATHSFVDYTRRTIDY